MFKEEFLKQKAIVTLILFVMIWFSFGFLSSKEGPTNSETFTYALTNAMPIAANSNTAIGQETTPVWHEQSYYKGYTDLNDNSNFSYGTINENCAENGLAPFYYFLLHTFVSFFHYVISFSVISFILNSIFLFCTCYIIFLIGAKYLKNGWVGIGASILFGFSVACISGMICTQPYIMTLLFVMTNLYLLLKALDDHELRGSVCRMLVCSTTLGILTDYSFLYYLLISSLIFSIFLLCFRHFKDLLSFFFTLIVSFLFVIALYPSFILHLFNGDFFVDLQTSSTTPITLFTNGFLFIKANLLIKEGLFVGMLLIILGLLAYILKKVTLKLHFDSFISRIKGLDLGDLFLVILGLFYFTFLVLFIPTDGYNSWLIIFPIISLLVTYLVYRFAHAFITSDFNSSFIGILMACLVCVFGMNSSQPMFLNEGYTKQLNLAKENQNSNCIFVEKQTGSSLPHILEIQYYQNTLLVDKGNLNSISSNDKMIKDSNSIILYVDNEKDTDKIVSTFQKRAKYQFSDILLSNHKDMTIYKLYRK